MVKIKKTNHTKYWWECGATGILIHCFWECKMIGTLWKTKEFLCPGDQWFKGSLGPGHKLKVVENWICNYAKEGASESPREQCE